jgi:tRNA threonylcarbamoyladenosine biosynthesis protein TsaE
MTVTDLAAASARATTRMPPIHAWTVRLEGLLQVKRLGAQLAGALAPGDVVLLAGDLGAGKTELARAIIQARLGEATGVPSPTFTLVQSYEATGLLMTHADLYRIERIGDLAELGLDEAMESGAVLVEWPDRARGLWPASRLEIELRIEDEGPARIVTMTGRGAWAGRLAALNEGSQ